MPGEALEESEFRRAGGRCSSIKPVSPAGGPRKQKNPRVHNFSGSSHSSRYVNGASSDDELS